MPMSKQTKRRIKQAVSVVIAVPTALTGIGVVRNAVDDENQIKRQRVSSFFRNSYYPTAMAEPPKALAKLTTKDFQGLPVGEPVQFRKYWSGVEAVEDVRVSKTDETNDFMLSYRVKYENPKVRAENITVLVTVVCSSRFFSYSPIGSCPAERVRLDDAQRVPS